MTGNITMAMFTSTMGMTTTIPVITIGVDVSMPVMTATGGMPNAIPGLALCWVHSLRIPPMPQ